VRKAAPFVAVAIAAAASPADGRASLFFLFDRTKADPNDRVTVRTGGTAKGFTLSPRAKRFGRPTRLYLVPNALASEVHSRFDTRLAFVGVLVRSARGRGSLTFSVPPVDTGDYTLAYWCPDCAAHSRGRTFFVQQVADWIEPYRSRALLRVNMPPATEQCPVTAPNGNAPPGESRSPPWYGNGLFWTALTPDGVRVARRENVAPDGSIFDKLAWLVAAGIGGPLKLRGERLDGPAAPLRVLAISQGQSVPKGRFRGAGFASAVVFPSKGCWRITGHRADISLSFVVKVITG